MPSNIPNRSINYVELNGTKLLNSPLSVYIKGRFGATQAAWWKPVCKLSQFDSVDAVGGINLTGSFGGYMSDQISHIDIAINNRQYSGSDPSPLRVVGTYKPRISTSGLSTDTVPHRTIEVRKSGDDMIVYVRGYDYSLFDLRVTVARTYNADTYPEWLWDENSGVSLEEPEGEVIWDLIKDMSPTPDMKRVVDYITNPRDDNYAQQLFPSYSSAPAENVDIDDYTDAGIYDCPAWANSGEYIDNLPFDSANPSGFTLIVTRVTGAPDAELPNRTMIQTLITADNGTFQRRYRGSLGTWSDWIRTDLNAIQAGTNITKTIDEQGRVVLSAAGGMTREEILEVLGYTEIELSKTDANNNTITVHVLGRVG